MRRFQIVLMTIPLIVASCSAPEPDRAPPVAADTVGREASQPTRLIDDARQADALTVDGWGPLRIGMTRAEVEHAVGGPANPELVGGPEPEICDEFRPARAPEGMLLMIERDTLTRITLIRESAIRTTAGIGVGDEQSAVLAAHGGAAEVVPHKYLSPPAAYITVRGVAPSGRGFVYATGTDRRVTHVHAGGPSIHYVEGCL